MKTFHRSNFHKDKLNARKKEVGTMSRVFILIFIVMPAPQVTYAQLQALQNECQENWEDVHPYILTVVENANKNSDPIETKERSATGHFFLMFFSDNVGNRTTIHGTFYRNKDGKIAVCNVQAFMQIDCNGKEIWIFNQEGR